MVAGTEATGVQERMVCSRQGEQVVGEGQMLEEDQAAEEGQVVNRNR